MDAEATTLIGTRVRGGRIDALEDGLLALTLHGAGVHGGLIIGLSERVRGVGWQSERRPSGRAAGAFALQCKSRLDGARVTNIAWLGTGHDVLRLSFERGGETLTVVAELRGASGDARFVSGDAAADAREFRWWIGRCCTQRAKGCCRAMPHSLSIATSASWPVR